MQTTQSNLARVRPVLDGIIAAALFLLTLFVYLQTLAPSVAYLFDDSLEFQLLASRLAIAHPTGYPFYSILLKLATFLPFGDVAYRANLVSALSARAPSRSCISPRICLRCILCAPNRSRAKF